MAVREPEPLTWSTVAGLRPVVGGGVLAPPPVVTRFGSLPNLDPMVLRMRELLRNSYGSPHATDIMFRNAF